MTSALTEVTLQQHEIEKTLVGLILIDGENARKQIGWLSPDTFTDETLKEFWSTVRDGNDAGETAIHQGIFTEVTKYLNNAPNIAHISSYANTLQKKAYERDVIIGCQDMVKAVQSGNVREVDLILEVMRGMNNSSGLKMRQADEISASLNDRIDQGDISVPFGIASVDYATAGTESGTLTILAGRPSMGKSSLAFQWAEHQALNLELKVGFFALEMSAEQMFARRCCHLIGKSWQDVRSGQITDEEKAELQGHVTRYGKTLKGKMFVNDDTSTTSTDIIRTQQREQFDVIYIDHIGLLKDRRIRGERTDQLLGRMTMALHELAKDYMCVVIGLAQLNRKVEDRTNNRPTMSDLRDSGKIEENADNIILLFRESYYDRSIQHAIDPMELILGKFRDGARSANCWVGFDLVGQRFVSMTQQEINDMSEEKMEEANGKNKSAVVVGKGQLVEAQQQDIPF